MVLKMLLLNLCMGRTRVPSVEVEQQTGADPPKQALQLVSAVEFIAA